MNRDLDQNSLKKRLNTDLLLLVSVTVLINLPFLDCRVVPAHDTLHVFSMFHYFYSGFFFDREIPLWLHYGVYGLPAAVDQITTLQPASYFVGLIGGLTRIKDALLLFKLSILIGELIFLTGMYLLSRLLFSSRSAVFIVCLGAVCSSVWLIQLTFGFVIYYMLPFVFYFIIRSSVESRPELLWVAGIFTIIGMIGNYAYLAPVYLLTVSVFSLVLLVGNKSWRYLFSPSLKNILSFLTMSAMLCAYVYFMTHQLKYLTLFHETGQMVQGETIRLAPFPLSTFLTHGADMIGTFKFPELLSGMRIHHTPVTLYIGILPLIFFVVALFKARTVCFAAFIITMAVLVGLTSGGIIAAGLYFFPGMFFFRHLGHTYGLVKILILICAGFGMNYFFTHFDRFLVFVKHDKRPADLFSRKNLVILFFLCLLFVDVIISYHFHNYGAPGTVRTDTISAVVFAARVLIHILAGLLIFKWIKQWTGSGSIIIKRTRIVIICVFLLDMLSFQTMSYLSVPFPDSRLESALYSLRVNRLAYQPERTDNPGERRQIDLRNLLEREIPYRNTLYHHSFQAITQQDTCSPMVYRDVVLPAGVNCLLRIRGGQPEKLSENSFLPRHDRSFLKSIGCESPKLRVISSARKADTIEEASGILKTKNDLDNFFVWREGIRHGEFLDKSISKTIAAERVTFDSHSPAGFPVTWSYKNNGDIEVETFWETTGPFPHWARFDLAFAQKVSTYFLQPGPHGADSTGRMPKDWEFQGSDDLSSWHVLDKQSGRTTWRNLERKYFDLPDAQAYRYYRLHVESGVDDKIFRLTRLGFRIDPPQNNRSNGHGFPGDPDTDPATDSDIEVIEFCANRMRLSVETDRESWLVYADSFHPGWKAYIDQKPVSIMEANLAFKALKMEPGTHEVVFEFFHGFGSAICVALAVLGVGFTGGVLFLLGLLIALNPGGSSFP